MIRTVSLCVIRRGEEILLEEFYDKAVGVTFYRPVGGTVEYGESSKHTIIREVKEEINADILEPELIGVIENIFAHGNDVGHEIDFIYEASLKDQTLCSLEEIAGIEGTNPYKAVWKSLDFFEDNAEVKLVPDGLSELLQDGVKKNQIGHISVSLL